MKTKIAELLALLLMSLIFLSIPYFICNSPVFLSDSENDGVHAARLQSISVPLYSVGRDADTGKETLSEKCHGFNAAVNGASDISFVVTAGHCGGDDLAVKIPGTNEGTQISVIAQVLYGDTDYLIGTKPFCGKSERVATFPHPFWEWLVFTKGETYYVLGTAGDIGKDGDQTHGLTKLVFVRKEPPNRLVFALGAPENGKEFSLDCGPKCGAYVKQGISGSVILNKKGEAVGIANGFSQMSIFEVYGISAKRFLPELLSAQKALYEETLVSGICDGGKQ